MKLSKLLEKADIEYDLVDQYDLEVDIRSVTLLKNAEELKSGILYIGEYQEMPKTAAEGISYICRGTKDCCYEKTGLQNVMLSTEETAVLIDKIYNYLEDPIFMMDCMENLTQISSMGLGINALLEELYRMTNVAAIVSDMSYRTLGYNKAILQIPDFREAVEKRILPKRRIEHLKKEDLDYALRNYDDLYFMWGEVDQQYFLASIIKIDEVEMAHFVALVGKEEPLKYHKLIRFINHLITIELEKSTFYNRNESIYEYNVMKGMLEETLAPSELQQHLNRLNWNLTKNMRVLVISGHGEKLDPLTIRQILRKTAQLFEEYHYIFYAGHCVVLCSVKREEEFDRLTAMLEKHRLLCGSSLEYTEIKDTSLAYQQALDVIKYILNGEINAIYADYHACLYCKIRDELAKNCRIQQFCHPAILLLYQYDQEHHTNLLETLEAYLKYNNDPDKATKSIHIHRNTLYYRINKMQEEYQLNLNDGYERMHILLTIQFLK